MKYTALEYIFNNMLEKWDNLNIKYSNDDVQEWCKLLEQIPCDSIVNLEWW